MPRNISRLAVLANEFITALKTKQVIYPLTNTIRIISGKDRIPYEHVSPTNMVVGSYIPRFNEPQQNMIKGAYLHLDPDRFIGSCIDPNLENYEPDRTLPKND